MAQRRGCRRNVGRTAVCAAQEETGTAIRAVEEMPMCRHVNTIDRRNDCCCMERQLCQISQMLDAQGRMLAELLQEVRGQ